MTHSNLTDADLLSRYQAGDEGAFAALVRAHERLVIGTAARVTGDLELARDVAQQVFATLAQKAWLLADRASLAGWLHHAARHIALRVVRGEAARQRRHEKTAGEGAATRDSDAWPVLEDALAALHEAEREAVVMHYLQDRSYSEMAAALGVTEAAARKRVSRGLENLGAQLRRRGIGRSAAALLAGAVALQVGMPTVTVAATVATTASFSLTLTTLMAHTAVKIAAVLTLVAAVPLAWQSQANTELRQQLTALEKQPRSAAPIPSAATIPSNVGIALAAASPPVQDASVSRADTAVIHERIAAARRSRAEAESKLAKTQATVRRLEDEVVISHGTVEELARSFVRKIMPMIEATAAVEKLDDAERATEESKLTIQLDAIQRELRPLVKAMLKLEERPADVARLNAIIFEEALSLPADVSKRIERSLLADFEQLKRDGLTSSLRPKVNPDAWIARRKAASESMEKNLKTLVPPEALTHPMFESGDGLLMDLSDDELNYLAEEPKATPRPSTKQP